MNHTRVKINASLTSKIDAIKEYDNNWRSVVDFYINGKFVHQYTSETTYLTRAQALAAGDELWKFTKENFGSINQYEH